MDLGMRKTNSDDFPVVTTLPSMMNCLKNTLGIPIT
jgi:hypothetical protein